jgi:hypothetical protein
VPTATKTRPSRTANQEVLAKIQAIAPHNAPKATTIHRDIAKGRQSVVFTETLQVGAAKLRIRIESDSYDFQCSARIEAFSPTDLKWNPLAHIHHANMKTPDKLVYHPANEGTNPAYFQADRDNLLNQARAILA